MAGDGSLMLLLDTHALVFLASDQKKLTSHGKSLLRQAAGLPDIHNDPFDRLLIASAVIHRLDLFSRDTVLPRYPGLNVVW